LRPAFAFVFHATPVSDPARLVSLAYFHAAVFSAESLSPPSAPVTAAPRATALTAVPSAPPDWRVEILAQPPQSIHPSVVCAAPDGRVFVAQNPIDMDQPSDAISDSILV
jgi:hypothetical protein